MMKSKFVFFFTYTRMFGFWCFLFRLILAFYPIESIWSHTIEVFSMVCNLMVHPEYSGPNLSWQKNLRWLRLQWYTALLSQKDVTLFVEKSIFKFFWKKGCKLVEIWLTGGFKDLSWNYFCRVHEPVLVACRVHLAHCFVRRLMVCHCRSNEPSICYQKIVLLQSKCLGIPIFNVYRHFLRYSVRRQWSQGRFSRRSRLV